MTVLSSPPVRDRRRARLATVLSRRADAARAAATPAAVPAPDPAPEPRLGTGPLRVVLLVGDLARPTPALAAALGATGELVVVGASSDPVEGVDLAADAAPDVVVVDRFFALGDGLAVARHLHRDAPRAAIVLRTPWPDADRHDAERAGVATTVDVAADVDALAAAIVAAGRPAGAA